MDYALPKFPSIKREVRRGRSVYDGYQRGGFLTSEENAKALHRDPVHAAGLAIARGRTLVAPQKRLNIFLILRHFLSTIPDGNIIEFGSYRGGFAMFMASVCKAERPNVRVFSLDTFAGMPSTDPAIDLNQKGRFADVDYEEMVAHAKASGLDNLEFVRGLFEDTAAAALERAGPIAIAHIDCDIRSAVAYSYDVVKPYLVNGAYVVFDDATVPGCIGATEAVEELVIRRDGKHAEQIFPHFVFRHNLE
jgi:predicted O-methyltransferase YrrM